MSLRKNLPAAPSTPPGMIVGSRGYVASRALAAGLIGPVAANAGGGGDRRGAYAAIEELQDGVTKAILAINTDRKSNDERFREIEAMMTDVATRAASRGLNGGGSGGGRDATAERKAWAGFVRTGDEGPLTEVRAQGMSVGSDPDGGYTVTPVMSDTIQKRIFDVSPLARLARNVQITTGDAFEEPWDISDIGAEWVGEKASRPALDSSQLRMLMVPVHEIYTNQPVTQKLMDDSSFDLGAWIEGKIGEKFARAAALAYVSGNGILKPKGLLTYPTEATADASRAWGTVQIINTGTSGGFGTAPNGSDKLLDTVYSLRAPYRQNARWLMNLNTAGAVRKLKDAEGRFMWADAREGQPATLAGFPVELDEEFPDIAANSLSIAFGDFAQAYLTVEKPGVRMLRDPFSSKPNVLVYAWARRGGALQNSEAVKLVRFGTA